MKYFDFVEKMFMKPMTKLSEQRHLKAIRDGIVSTLPLIIVGSFFLILAFPPFSKETLDNSIFKFMTDPNYVTKMLIPFRLTMGLMSIYAAYNIGHSLAKSYNLDGVSGGTIALMAFLLASVPKVGHFISLSESNDMMLAEPAQALGYVLPMGNLGGSGLFVAILCSILAVEVLRFFKSRGMIIKMPEGVPESVSRSFESLFPTATVVIIMFVVVQVLGVDLFKLLDKIFNPIKGVTNSLPGSLIIILLITMLWSAGIHGVSVIGALVRPMWLQLLDENTVARDQGMLVLPNIFTEQFYQWFIWIGGSGGTLSLVVLMLFAKSKYIKNLARVSIVPAIFNINEPIIFGLPIMLNPFFIIPFIVSPMITALITYFAMSLQIIERTYSLPPWTLPAPIGAFLSTGDWKAMILVMINIVISGIIYYPFLRAYDKKMLLEEENYEEVE